MSGVLTNPGPWTLIPLLPRPVRDAVGPSVILAAQWLRKCRSHADQIQGTFITFCRNDSTTLRSRTSTSATWNCKSFSHLPSNFDIEIHSDSCSKSDISRRNSFIWDFPSTSLGAVIIMHDLRRRALESSKTVSRRALSKQSSPATSRSNSRAPSRIASSAVSRAGSDDEDTGGELSDETSFRYILFKRS